MNDHPEHRDELDDALRQAVEHVRSQPLPLDAMRRSLERASRLNAVRARPWRGVGKRLLATAAMIVGILVGAEVLRPRLDEGDRVARDVDRLSQKLDDLRLLKERVERYRHLMNQARFDDADKDAKSEEFERLGRDYQKLTAEIEAVQQKAQGKEQELADIITKKDKEIKLLEEKYRSVANVDAVRLIATTDDLGRKEQRDKLQLLNKELDKAIRDEKINRVRVEWPASGGNDPGRRNPQFMLYNGQFPATLPQPATTAAGFMGGMANPTNLPGIAPAAAPIASLPAGPTATPSTPKPTETTARPVSSGYTAATNVKKQEEAEKQLKTLYSESWGHLPQKERDETIRRLAANLAPEHRQVVEQYYRTLSLNAMDASTLEAVYTATGLDPAKNGASLQAIKALSGKWQDMNEAERGRAVLLITELDTKKAEYDRATSHRMATLTAPKSKAYSEEELRSLKGKIASLEKEIKQLPATTNVKSGEKAKAPLVWHRDRQRPTVARVYIGDGNSLELVSLHVNVTVEGPRARTVVDHIFRNPHDRRLEGTFEYPLPTGASASYFAMFPGQTRDAVPPRFAAAREGRQAPGAESPTGDDFKTGTSAARQADPAELVRMVSRDDWGAPQEARIVNKQRALETYEDIVRTQIDPGLLEYAGGNTFSGRVFPIAPKGYTRVIFSYEELLPASGRGSHYRFPLPQQKIDDMRLTLSANESECQNAKFVPDDAATSAGAGQVRYVKAWKGAGPRPDVLFSFMPPRAEIQTISGRQGESGPVYLYSRIRPELKAKAAKPFAAHAVFLLDTSLSEHPDRFDVSMRLLRKILETDTSIERFNILTFDVAARWLEPKGWLKNDAAGRAAALRKLDGIVLEGATNLESAFEKVVQMAKHGPGVKLEAENPLNLFLLSDGQLTWGETEVPALVSRFERDCPFFVQFNCYRTGIGAENQELFEGLTRRGGGIFQCYGEAELDATAAAHRQQCLQVERVTLKGAETSDLLVGGRKTAIYPGGELIVAARANEPGRATLVVEGTFLGKRVVEEYPVEFKAVGELAPRGWAELAVASLLALNDPKLDSLVTAYCQQFGIGSKVASFLILENANDYKRLNLEEERGKTVPGGDLGIFLDQTWKKLGEVLGAKATFERFLARIDSRIPLKTGPQGQHVQKMLELLSEKDFELPANRLEGRLLHQQDVPPAYLVARQKNRRDVSAYLTEAKRRAGQKDEAGAVRALASIIEEFPTRSDALRLVGYRLLDLKQPAQAVRLFRQVQESRPFEPHSYRDLARSLEDCGMYGAAAVQYEIVLAGTWHARFHQAIKDVTLEEYVGMMRQAIQQRAVSNQLMEHFGERLEHLAAVKTENDLRVTISWNTDATDVDLWVIEPDGTKCFYSHNRTKNGGTLSQDQTQGYGPERYHVAKALPGTYTILVHYFGVNRNLLAGESNVNVRVTKFAGTPQETTQRYTVILKQHNEQVEVAKVRFAGDLAK
jgi:hypothetical protein